MAFASSSSNCLFLNAQMNPARPISPRNKETGIRNNSESITNYLTLNEFKTTKIDEKLIAAAATSGVTYPKNAIGIATKL